MLRGLYRSGNFMGCDRKSGFSIDNTSQYRLNEPLCMSQPLIDESEFSEFLGSHPLCAVYFTGPDCGVCQALKPRLFAMLSDRFPQLAVGEIDCSRCPGLAAQQMVFTIPALIVYIEGRENLRKVRAFSPAELARELERPYAIMTG
jgi:thiol-disulfide isomerase/thioredoxin